MSVALLARKIEAARAPKAKAPSNGASSGLRIGEPNDAFEREADRVAEEVMAGGRARPEWSLSKVSVGTPLQRECACGGSGGASGECKECKKNTLQRKATGPGETGFAPPAVHDVLSSPGWPLDQATRDFFEPRFGHDFSRVRVHADSTASRSAEAVAAQAYTVADDIVFNQRQYSPNSAQGRKLLAHELAHVVQQQDRTLAPLRRQPLDPEEESGPARKQKDCVERLGGCPGTVSGGIPTCDDIASYNRQCRPETGYTGADLNADCPNGFVPECKTPETGDQAAPQQDQPAKDQTPPPLTSSTCSTPYTQATSFQQLIDLVRAAETRLAAAGIASTKDQIHALRGIYYGTSWSLDYTGTASVKGEASETRNEGFQRFTRPSEPPEKSVPRDVRGILDCGLFDALKASQDVVQPDRQIDFGHLIIALDARFDPAFASNVTYPYLFKEVEMGGTGTELVTWLGDLGGGAAKVAIARAARGTESVGIAFSAPSDYGGTINLEGDVAGSVIASSSKTSPTPPSIPVGKRLSDALQDYLSPAAAGSAWKTRASTFLGMYGGQLDATGNLTNGTALSAAFAPKIQTFACNYLASRVKDRHIAFDVAKRAADHVIPASEEVAEAFVNALASSAKTGDTIEAKPPFPAAKPAQRGACTEQILAAGLIGGAKGLLQPKLAVGSVDDPLEREADRAADRVMHMPVPTVIFSAGKGGELRRKCQACAEEAKTEEEGDIQQGLLRRHSSAPTALDATSVPNIVHDVLRSPSQPLDSTTRAFFEPRFGRDLSAVRVHTDPKAAKSAIGLHALAYTVGRDVVFGTGQHAPEMTASRRLLAHESAHQSVNSFGGGLASVVHEAVNSSGTSLDAGTRNFFEPRFGHDFSRVRVHADSTARASARVINAAAYTVGNDIVFDSGQYDPSTIKGRHVLAHELTHVAQQAGFQKAANEDGRIRRAGVSQEREADQMSLRVLRGQKVSPPEKVEGPALACFGDTTHHVIEEAALPGAGFAPEQVRSIERGNVQRDYSQVGAAGNAALLGQAKSFGGYAPEEHFDNFIFDAVTNRWRTRGAGQQKFLHLDPKAPDASPIDYISSQLSELATAGMTEDSLVHLGNVFHTVEDFFAHSNFIELTRKDYRFGQDLLTGSYGDNSANSSVSLAHTLGAVSTPSMHAYYEHQADEQTQLTEPRSHSRLAKDTPSSPGFAEARRLAALVIQELGAAIIVVMRNAQPDVRARLMNETVMVKIRQYLRPPDPRDPWWKALVSQGGGSMDARLADAEKRTPVTVNQAVFSPLRNLEASKDSNMGIPLGLAVSLGSGTWLQAGAGVTRPSALDASLPGPENGSEQKSAPFIGGQLVGRF